MNGSSASARKPTRMTSQRPSFGSPETIEVAVEQGVFVKLHQCLFGYDDGHRLLSASLKLPEEAASLLLMHSDRVPGPNSGRIEGYSDRDARPGRESLCPDANLAGAGDAPTRLRLDPCRADRARRHSSIPGPRGSRIVFCPPNVGGI